MRSRRADRKRVGEAVSGNVAAAIGEGGRVSAVANRRIATIRAAATIVQDGCRFALTSALLPLVLH